MPVQFVRLCKWDAWANRQVLETLRACGGEPRNALAAFQHVLATELTWLDRMDGDATAFLPQWAEPSLERCQEWFGRSSARLQALATKLADGYGESAFPYKNSTGTPFVGQVDEILTHVFMHSSQYRGEAAGFLNAAAHRVPDLDLVFWMRSGEPA